MFLVSWNFSRPNISVVPLKEMKHSENYLKKKKKSVMVDMPILYKWILTCIFFTFNWLTLTSEIHFVNFHPVIASCITLQRQKKVCTPGDEAIMKIHKLFSGIPFLLYLKNYKEFEPEILDLQSEKWWAFIWYQKIYYFRLSPGDENVIGIRG